MTMHYSGLLANRSSQSANDALKESEKSGGDDALAKIILVYEKIEANPRTSLSTIAQELGLSDRAIDEYIEECWCTAPKRR